MVRGPFRQYLVADRYEFSSMPQELHTQPLYKIMGVIGCMEGLVKIIKDLPPPGPLWRRAASFVAYLSLFLPKLVTGEGACSQKAFQQLENQGINVISRNWMSPTVMKIAIAHSVIASLCGSI